MDKMDKIMGEDEIKKLEEEIDSAVDQLFVDKKGIEKEKVLMEPSTEPSFEPPIEKPSFRIDQDLDVERVLHPSLTPLPSLNLLETMETQLLSLEWEITKENVEKTKKEVSSLRESFEEKSDISSVLIFMENVLDHMIQNEENIRPPFIKFLLDSKETIKLLMRKEMDSEINMYKQLTFAGIEARFSCLEAWINPQITEPPLSRGGDLERRGMPAIGEKKVEEIDNKISLFSEKMDEIFKTIDQYLLRLQEMTAKSLEIPSKFQVETRPLTIDITIFKIDEKFFGIESDKVFKLFKVPGTFFEKYSNYQKIRLKDFEVKVINLRETFSMQRGEIKEEIKLLIVKSNGEYIGLAVDEVIKKLATQWDKKKEMGEYFQGMIHWTYQNRPIEVPVLDLKSI